MATGTLVIMEVNLELLEEQRVVLQGITDIELSQVQMEAIQGIENMLDVWSDELYFKGVNES